MLKKLPVILACLLVANCFPYVYHQQQRALIRGVDVTATLEIARIELEEGGFDATLTVWAIRDQIVTRENARTVSDLYFRHIDRVASEKDQGAAEFGVWHFTWAISNLYRNGHDGIKAELERAYEDALKRPARLKNFKDIATEHVNGRRLYMGDIHGVARSFARAHVVAPGNEKYLQSLDQYKQNKGRPSLEPRDAAHPRDHR